MKQDLLGLKELSADSIIAILDAAATMKTMLQQGKRQALLQGRSAATLFYENSTRTRNSFETAAKFLGAYTTSITAAASSVSKGESLVDTGRNLDALFTNIIVVRHSMAGAPHLLARSVRASVVNAGDGANEHPTQALLDVFTMREHFGTIKGLKVVMSGDITYSRVARSNIWGLTKLGAKVVLAAPQTLLPCGITEMGCEISRTLNDAVDGANVIMGLRIQNERQAMGMFPSAAEYAYFFSITESHIRRAAAGVLVMHPGPVNRGVELSSDAADSTSSVILEQVSNGVAVRMAVMNMLINS